MAYVSGNPANVQSPPRLRVSNMVSFVRKFPQFLLLLLLISEEIEYVNPLRWCFHSAFCRVYSLFRWAFGIVLWEICTLGEYHAMLDFPTSLPLLIGRPSFNVAGGFPYPTVNDRDLLVFLMEGNRMEKPSNCTDAMWGIWIFAISFLWAYHSL